MDGMAIAPSFSRSLFGWDGTQASSTSTTNRIGRVSTFAHFISRRIKMFANWYAL
jgi:hypothetical protein